MMLSRSCVQKGVVVMSRDLMRAPARRRTLHAAIYLLLSLLAGVFELGVVMSAIREGAPPVAFLVLALAYQCGALLREPIALTGRYYRLILLVALVAAVYPDRGPWLLVATVFLISVGLQGIREEALQGRRVGTFAKRASRIVGFVGAGFFSLNMLALVPAVVLALAIILNVAGSVMTEDVRLLKPRHLGTADVAMIVHQAHYFTYAYMIPFLFTHEHGFSGVMAGLAFAVGWVSYSMTPLLLGRVSVLPVVLIGHSVVALSLMTIMVDGGSLQVLLIAWFVSGFGGGSVFGIRRLAELWAAGKQADGMDTWENIGHVLGVGSAIAVSAMTGQVGLVFFAASVFALVTMFVVGAAALAGSIQKNRRAATFPIGVAGQTDDVRLRDRAAGDPDESR